MLCSLTILFSQSFGKLWMYTWCWVDAGTKKIVSPPQEVYNLIWHKTGETFIHPTNTYWACSLQQTTLMQDRNLSSITELQTIVIVKRKFSKWQWYKNIPLLQKPGTDKNEKEKQKKEKISHGQKTYNKFWTLKLKYFAYRKASYTLTRCPFSHILCTILKCSLIFHPSTQMIKERKLEERNC